MKSPKENFLNEKILKYSKGLTFQECANNIPNYTFTKGEMIAITYIQRIIPLICKRFLNGEISKKEISQKANYILFDKYDPNILGRLVKKDLIDFLMVLGE